MEEKEMIRKYLKPEMQIIKFETNDIITTSITELTTMINGKDATNYGQQNVEEIFEEN